MPDAVEFEMVDPDWALGQLQERLGYVFRQPRLALESLTHSSSANTRDASNERMEFLGDAVLGFCTCEYLFSRFSVWNEGELTQLKSLIVSRQTCAVWARRIGMEDLLIVGKGVGVRGRLPASLLANAFESVIAAVFLDSGLEAAKRILIPRIAEMADEACQTEVESNFKSVLQQMVQKDHGRPPSYILVEESGPDHDKSFCIAAQIGSRRFEPGWGKNKKQAEQRAAGNALDQLAREGMVIEPLPAGTVPSGSEG